MKKALYKKLKNLIEKGYVKRNFDLTEYNTYKLKSICSIAVIVNSIETFLKTMSICEKEGVAPIVLGRGSNVILMPKIDGVVIIFGEKFSNVYNMDNYIIAESGASLSQVIKCAKDNSLTGMEDAIGIPASVGGALFMNASAFSFEMSKVVSSVLVYTNGLIKNINIDELKFGYRYSSFQNSSDVILRVEFQLTNGNKKEIEEKMRNTIAKRSEKQKSLYPNAGSVFKNGNNYFAGELIDKCGLKNYNINDAYVSNFHANFIENRGKATAKDITELINYIKKVCLNIYGVELECEQKFIGE